VTEIKSIKSIKLAILFFFSIIFANISNNKNFLWITKIDIYTIRNRTNDTPYMTYELKFIKKPTYPPLSPLLVSELL
jgi:hypothetical protein